MLNIYNKTKYTKCKMYTNDLNLHDQTILHQERNAHYTET